MEGPVLRDKRVFQITVCGAEILVPRWEGFPGAPWSLEPPCALTEHLALSPQPRGALLWLPWGLQQQRIHLQSRRCRRPGMHGVAMHSSMLAGKSPGRRSLASLTESSSRAGTIFISCLHSPPGIAECFPLLKSSISICRMNESITKIEKLLQISLSEQLTPCKTCPLQSQHFFFFCFKCFECNPTNKTLSSSVSFLILRLHTGLLIRMLKSHPLCSLAFISPS